MRALITGASGQLGCDLEALLGPDSRGFSHSELDITDAAALDAAFAEVRPDVVFNCAAFHNVELCEQDPERAWRVNVEAVRELARRSPYLVHFSTNYVFDGLQAEPYGEYDLPAPESVYALTKLAGEHAALAYADSTLVIRAAGLYGLNGSVSKGGNFVERMVTRARQQGQLRMVADQYLQPTFTADLAAAVIDAAESNTEGVIHLTATGACSWLEFTAAIMQTAGIEVPIEPVLTEAAPRGVARPLNGVLARPRADRLGLAPLRPWRAGLADYMERAGLTLAV
jgi:dTDP-4-dehydrorhamnose reductase